MSEVLFPVELLEKSRYCDLGCSGNAEFFVDVPEKVA